MGRKVIALIDSDPVLKEICTKLENNREQMDQKIKFLQKQADNFAEEMRKDDEVQFDLLVAKLKEKGIITEYNKDKAHLSIDFEANAINLCDHSDGNHGHPLMGLFEILNGRRRE